MFETLKSTLKLERPIVFFDLETTGTDIENDRIVEIAFLQILPPGSDQIEVFRDEYKLNPGIPIPAAASAIHGIKDEDVADCPTFKDIAADIHDVMRGCDLCGHNVNGFDIPLLAAEFRRAGMDIPEYGESIDTYEIFRAFFNHSLESAYRYYMGVGMEDAHSAWGDVKATAKVFEKMIAQHDLNPNPSILGSKPIDSTWLDRQGKFRWADGEAVFTFGSKVIGHSLQWVAKHERGFMTWMLSKDFSDEVKGIIHAALDGDFPVEATFQ